MVAMMDVYRTRLVSAKFGKEGGGRTLRRNLPGAILGGMLSVVSHSSWELTCTRPSARQYGGWGMTRALGASHAGGAQTQAQHVQHRC